MNKSLNLNINSGIIICLQESKLTIFVKKQQLIFFYCSVICNIYLLCNVQGYPQRLRIQIKL